jgi:hypothetical protein
MKDQNYYDTFIQIAEDCSVMAAEIPPEKAGEKTVANIHYEIISKHPGKYTQEDVLFMTFAFRNGIVKSGMKKAREEFFSKGQPCLRTSPLGKRYGWGIHCDKDGKVALVAMGTKEYKKLASDKTIKHLKAMRSKR